jgi:hypothetical protein
MDVDLVELTNIERSLGMAPLSIDTQRHLVEACSRFLHERTRILELIATLPEPVGELRSVLNELHRLLTTAPPVGR